MTRPTSDSVVAAIQKSIDAPKFALHAVLPTGESDHLWFYLVMMEVPHRDAGNGDVPADATLLQERYFQMPKDTAPPEADLSPTFKKNGINRRDTGDLKPRLVRAYARISNSEGVDTDADLDPLWLDEAEG